MKLDYEESAIWGEQLWVQERYNVDAFIWKIWTEKNLDLKGKSDLRCL